MQYKVEVDYKDRSKFLIQFLNTDYQLWLCLDNQRFDTIKEAEKQIKKLNDANKIKTKNTR